MTSKEATTQASVKAQTVPENGEIAEVKPPVSNSKPENLLEFSKDAETLKNISKLTVATSVRTSKTLSPSSNPLPLYEIPTREVLREYFSSSKETVKLKAPSVISASAAAPAGGSFSSSSPSDLGTQVSFNRTLSSIVSTSDEANDKGDLSEGVQADEINGEDEKLGSGSLKSVCSLKNGTEVEVGKAGKCWIRYRGILLAIICSIQVALQVYLAYVLSKRGVPMPILLITRFLFLLFLSAICIPICQFQAHVQVLSTVCPMSTRDRKWSVFRCISRATCGAIAIACQFYSVLFIKPADSTVIMQCNMIFVGIFARIFLKEPLSVVQIIAALLAIAGVVVIANPSADFTINQLYGILFALTAMVLTTASVLLLRTLRHLHFSVINAVFGLVGSITGVILALATDTFYKKIDLTLQDYGLLVVLGLTSFGGIVCLTMALKYEEAGVVSIARSTEVVFSFLWQMISGIYPDLISLSGAALIMLCIVITGFYKYLSGLDPSNKLRKRLWFCLK